MIWGLRAFEGRRGLSRRASPLRVALSALLAGAGLGAMGMGAASAETVNGALIKAYLSNPDINTQRAAVRHTDERHRRLAAALRIVEQYNLPSVLRPG